MAQVEQYKGKLGFEHRSEEKLTQALTELLDTLEEFGHPAVQINARESHRIGLDCDHYRVTLRLRRIPLRLGVRSPVGVPAPAAYIELAMTPCFPAACDQEISEILLAVILKRLTEALDPLVIFWQETNHPLTPKQFIGAFAPQDVEPQPQQLLQAAPFELQSDTQDTLTEARVERHCKEPIGPDPVAARPVPENAVADMSPAAQRLWKADQARAEAEAERARGQARFGSADAVTPELERHCDEIQPSPRRIQPRNRTSRTPRSAAPHASYQTVFGKSRLSRVLALPRAAVSLTLNSIRSVDLVLSVRALVTAMVVLFLHGSGMVQAAARVLLPQ